MRRIVGCSLVFLSIVAGMAWAGDEAYKLVMSKDTELCSHMLNLFKKDIKKYDAIKYEEHEVFKRVQWEPIDLGDKTYGCRLLRRANFDINNDGKEDLVIKYSGA